MSCIIMISHVYIYSREQGIEELATKIRDQFLGRLSKTLEPKVMLKTLKLLRRFEIPERALWCGLERLTQWRRLPMLMMQRQNFILIITAPDSTLVVGGGERT